MFELRLHGRGGQGSVTANWMLAEALYYDGKYGQAIPIYGTERRGAPVTAYMRIDDARVRQRDLIHEPDMVVVLDPLLGLRPMVMSGIKKGGLLLLNYPHPPEEVLLGGDFNIATVDATMIALETLGVPITNTAMLGAFCKVTGLVRMESLERAVLHTFPGRIGKININAMREAYEKVSTPVPSKGEAPKAAGEEEIDGDVRVGWGLQRNVASWRVFRPVWDYDKCNSCKICWISCPDNAINWTDKPEWENRKCKGCGICFNECAAKAIAWVREEI